MKVKSDMKCENCYWNMQSTNCNVCMLKNSKIKDKEEVCENYKYRCSICHKKVGINTSRFLNNGKDRVCTDCFIKTLVNDYNNLQHEMDFKDDDIMILEDTIKDYEKKLRQYENNKTSN